MPLLTNYLHRTRSKKVLPYVKGDVLDLGCGPAYFLRESKNKIKSYYGVDSDRKTIQNNRKLFPESKFFVRDLDENKLNFNKKFDVILMVALIEHIFNQKHLFKEAVNCLKPNGIIVITTPTTFGNDIVHRIGGKLNLFSKIAVDDHIVIFNKKRIDILSKELNLKIKKYNNFELFCNQIIVLEK